MRAPTLVMTIRTDALYPPYQQHALRDLLRATALRVGYYDIDSADGHDGFLTRVDRRSLRSSRRSSTAPTNPTDHP